MEHSEDLDVDFMQENWRPVDFKKENWRPHPEKTPWSTGEANYNNFHSHKNQQQGHSQAFTHPSTNPIWPGLTSEETC